MNGEEIEAELSQLLQDEGFAKIAMEETLARLSVGINKDQYTTGKFMGKAEFTAFAKAQPEYVEAARTWATAYAVRRGYEKALDFAISERSKNGQG
jgi:hypothetical protein